MMGQSNPSPQFRGRGGMRSMVEGQGAKRALVRRLRRRPSTSLRLVPLPCKSRGG